MKDDQHGCYMGMSISQHHHASIRSKGEVEKPLEIAFTFVRWRQVRRPRSGDNSLVSSMASRLAQVEQTNKWLGEVARGASSADVKQFSALSDMAFDRCGSEVGHRQLTAKLQKQNLEMEELREQLARARQHTSPGLV